MTLLLLGKVKMKNFRERGQYFNEAKMLFCWQLFAHLSVIPMVVFGEWSHYVYSFIVYFFTGCFGMTMTYHRLLSHKSWSAPRWFFYFGTLCAVLGLTGSPIAWAAIHREHHRYTDTDKDPHSPEMIGFMKAQWGSMFCSVKIKYVIDLIKDDFLGFVHRNYFKIQLFWIILLGVLLGPFSIVYLYLFPAFILWNMGSFIITLSHIYGYKNFENKDDSKNIVWLGYLLWGEGWHNNHHAYPQNSQFSYLWWEFDLGGFFIRLLDRNTIGERVSGES